jgi:hypothetical protein
MSPRIRNIGIIAILVAVIIAAMMIGVAWVSDNSHVNAPSVAPEIPSSITVNEVGLPQGYNWTIDVVHNVANGRLDTTYFIQAGQSITIYNVSTLYDIRQDGYFPPPGNNSPTGGTVYIALPLNGFYFGSSNMVINSTYTFYYYPAVNIEFIVSGAPSTVRWNLNITEGIGSIYGPQVLTLSAGGTGNMSTSLAVLPGGNLSYSFFINPTSGYVSQPSSGHVYVKEANSLVRVDVHKQVYWYALPAYWFNEGKSLAIDYWWAILIIVIGGFVGYLFEVGLPSREEIRKDLRKVEKKVKK